MDDFRCGFPDWILCAMVTGGPPENTALLLEWTVLDALATLHDSHWYGLAPDVAPANDILLAIQRDHFWQVEPIKSFLTTNQAGGAVLFLKFCGVTSLQFRNYSTPDLPWGPIAGATYEPTTLTPAIENIYGGATEISPVCEVGCWFYDKAGVDHTTLLRQAIMKPQIDTSER